MNKRGNTIVILVILLVIVLSGVVLYFGGVQLFDIGRSSSRQVTALGHSWTISMPPEGLGQQLGCPAATITQTNSSSELSLSVVTPYSDKSCYYQHNIEARLDIDLRTIETLSVTRGGEVRLNCREYCKVETRTNNLKYYGVKDTSEIRRSLTSISVFKSGNTIIIDSQEGRQIITPTGPVYLEFGTRYDNDARNYGGENRITVTAVDVVYTTQAQPPVVVQPPQPPVISEPPVQSDPLVTPVTPPNDTPVVENPSATQWYSAVWQWIKGLFSW